MKFVENLKLLKLDWRYKMEFNKENFEESKQRIIDIINKVSEEEIKEWEKRRNDFEGWDFYRLMDVCLLLLAPFSFRISDGDVYDAVNATGRKFMKQNLIARSLWDNTLRGKEYGLSTCSALDYYIRRKQLFAPPYSDKKNFFKWPIVKKYLEFLEHHDDILFIILKLKLDILQDIFQVVWWTGEELKRIENK